MPDATALTARGEATRRRILEAATEEFAEFGIAGARVDRITAAAQTNKAQLYAYFGSKDGLFDAVFSGSFEQIMDGVPIDATDLADWAVRLYDDYLVHPEVVRLATWARLERKPAGYLVPDDDRVDGSKLAAIAAAQRAGAIGSSADPFDVFAMVISMSLAWGPVSNVYAATADEDPALHRRRRELLRESVRRALGPG